MVEDQASASGLAVGRRRPRSLLTAARYVVAFALLFYLASSSGLQWSAIGNVITGWRITTGALALMLVGAVGTSWRFRLLLEPRKLDITMPASIRLTMIGLFFNTVLPGGGGGDFVRFYYGAWEHAGRRTEIVTVLLFDRIIGLFAMITWPLLAAPFFAPLWWGNQILAGLLVAGLVIALGMALVFLLSWSALSRSGGRLQRVVMSLPFGVWAWKVVETISSYRHHRGAVAAAIGVSLLVHTMGIGAALLVAAVVLPDAFAWSMSVLIPLGLMANAIPITPGGLGVGEAAFDSLFNLAGLDGGAEVLLGFRIIILLLGLVGLGFYLSGRRQFVRPVPSESG